MVIRAWSGSDRWTRVKWSRRCAMPTTIPANNLDFWLRIQESCHTFMIFHDHHHCHAIIITSICWETFSHFSHFDPRLPIFLRTRAGFVGDADSAVSMGRCPWSHWRIGFVPLTRQKMAMGHWDIWSLWNLWICPSLHRLGPTTDQTEWFFGFHWAWGNRTDVDITFQGQISIIPTSENKMVGTWKKAQ